MENDINSLNLDTLSVHYLAPIDKTSICVNGTGEAACSNEYTVNSVVVYNTTTETSELGTCNQQLPIKVTGSQQNSVDLTSGLSTSYGAGAQNIIHIGDLGQGAAHPFMSLQVLLDTIGDQELELSTLQEQFAVSAPSFINSEYPANTTQPTKQVKNGTEIATSHEKDVVTWSIILYILLMLVCLVLTVMFGKAVCKNDDGQNNVGTTLDEDRTPFVEGDSTTGGDGVVNISQSTGN